MRTLALLSVAALATFGCTAPVDGEDDSTSANAREALSTAGSLVLADGSVLPVQEVRAASTGTSLTALPVGTTSELAVLLPLGPAAAQLVAQTGKAWSLSLGAQGYSLGTPSVTRIGLPAAKKGDKGNAFITVSFKPTELKYLKASGDIVKPTVAPAPGPATFGLTLGPTATSATASIDAWSIDSSGRGSFVVQIPAAEIAAWSKVATSGALTYQSASGAVVVTLSGVTAEKPVRRDDSLQSYTVKLYSEHAKLEVKKTDA